MARERYLRGIEEETIHKGVLTADTTKAKAQNWWYYNKRKLLGCSIAVILVTSFVCSMVFKVHPDYTFAIMTEAQVDAGILDIMQDQLSPYCDDRNGDGKVVVSVINYSVAGPDSQQGGYDVAMQQAATIRFVGDMSTGESMIWLHDPVGYYCMSEQEQLFTPLKGDLEDPLMMPLTQVKALEELDFSAYENDYISPALIKEFLSKLRVSFREIQNSAIEKDKKLTAYYHDSKAVFENMITGTKQQ